MGGNNRTIHAVLLPLHFDLNIPTALRGRRDGRGDRRRRAVRLAHASCPHVLLRLLLPLSYIACALIIEVRARRSQLGACSLGACGACLAGGQPLDTGTRG